MKSLTILSIALLLTGVTAPAALFSSGTLNTTIPDGNPNGISFTINVSGMASSLADVNVSINVSGGFNGDLYAYLGYGNGSVVLLNRIGKTGGNPFGSESAGFIITFDGGAASDIHGVSGFSGSQVTGTYQPDGRTTDPQFVTDASARDSSLGSFNGVNPNGDWTIFFADMAGGGGGGPSSLVSWNLDITAVPEPVNAALGIFAGIGLMAGVWRAQPWKRKAKNQFA